MSSRFLFPRKDDRPMPSASAWPGTWGGISPWTEDQHCPFEHGRSLRLVRVPFFMIKADVQCMFDRLQTGGFS